MDTVFFVSSRSCSDNAEYQNWLLFHSDKGLNNVKKVQTGIKKENNTKEWLTDCVYKRIVNNLNDYKTQNLGSDIDDIIAYIPEDPVERLGIEKDVKGHIEKKLDVFLNITGVSREEVSFKDVFRVRGNDVCLYAVKELTENEKASLGNTLWCDLVIDYLLQLEESCKEIHLLLHDGDVSGYSINSLTHISNINECKSKGLISDSIYTKLNNQSKRLTITFFKHDNPFVRSLIGKDVDLDLAGNHLTDEKINALINQRFNSLLKHVGDIGELERYSELLEGGDNY